LNELYPGAIRNNSHCRKDARASFLAELAESRRTGELIVEGEAGLKLMSLPVAIPKQPSYGQDARAVWLSWRGAAHRRPGRHGELGLKLNELYPQLYRKKSAHHTHLPRAQWRSVIFVRCSASPTRHF